MSDKKKIALKALEGLLPKTATDAERAALRANPDKYKEYLKNLDIAFGDKEKRASDLNFGKDTFYHGSEATNIKKFDSSKSKTGQLYGRGNYVTKDPEEAGVYAQILDDNGHVSDDYSGSIYPLKVREGKSLSILKDPVDKALVEKWKASLPQYEKESLDKYGTDMYSAHQLVSGSIDPTKYSKDVVDSGYNSIAVDNNVRNIINKKDLRSVNAAFDPRFKDSADILAGKSAMPTELFNDQEKKLYEAAGPEVRKAMLAPKTGMAQKISNAISGMGLENANSTGMFEKADEALGRNYLLDKIQNAGQIVGKYLSPVYAGGAISPEEMAIGGANIPTPEASARGTGEVVRQIADVVTPSTNWLLNGGLPGAASVKKIAAKVEANTAKHLFNEAPESFGKTIIKEAPEQKLGNVMVKPSAADLAADRATSNFKPWKPGQSTVLKETPKSPYGDVYNSFEDQTKGIRKPSE